MQITAKQNDEWWDSKSRKDQLEYLKTVKDSKYKNKVKPLETKPVKPVVKHTPQDKKVLDTAKKDGVAIPPAWTDLQYFGKEGNEKGIIASGRNSRGDAVTLRSKTYTLNQIKLNHERINEQLTDKIFSSNVRKLKNLIKKGNEEAKVLYLISQTAFRVGSDRLRGEAQAYGASTLEGKHVKEVKGNKVVFEFIGKGGVTQHHEIDDALIANMVKGKKDNEKLFNTNDTKVIKAWRDLGGSEKVHDFRQYHATKIAKDYLAKVGDTSKMNKKEKQKIKREIGDLASKKLGNNRSQALSTYIDPEVLKVLE